MNTSDLEHYMREMTRIGEANAHLVKAYLNLQLFIAEYWILVMLVFAFWFALHLHATYSNLRTFTGVDRLTWLFTIWAVPFGLIFYWSLRYGPDVEPTSTQASTQHLSTASTPEAVAAAVTAALREKSQSRAARRPG